MDRDAYLLEVCRLVGLNRVRARMSSKPEAWPSCRAYMERSPVPAWLNTLGLHGYLLFRPRWQRGAAIVALAQRRSATSDSGPSLWSPGADLSAITATDPLSRGSASDESSVGSVLRCLE